MKMIDAKTAKELSSKANFGVQEILRGVDATIKARAKSGFQKAECSFPKEIVSEEEITAVLAEIESLSYEVLLKDNGHGFYTLNLSW